jgi:hypothetical protein
MYFFALISLIVGGIRSSGQAERSLSCVPTAGTTDISTKFYAHAKLAASELGWLTASIESMGQPCDIRTTANHEVTHRPMPAAGYAHGGVPTKIITGIGLVPVTAATSIQTQPDRRWRH